MTTRSGPAPGLRRRTLIAAGGLALSRLASAADAAAWSRTLAAARGRTVWFNAWGGSDRINAYLQWAAAELATRFDVRLQHVKLGDTGELVRRVRAEQQAGRLTDGSADVVWINGENFLAMKREGLLHGPFAEDLPNFAFVDTVGKPTTRLDFSEPVQGYEAAWGMAQLTFFADAKKLPAPPGDLKELLAFAKRQPGRFTYPKPPQFIGTTFLKQVLLEAAPDRAPFARPAGADAAALLQPLWSVLDTLHPLLWRQGRQFPATPAAQRQMVADGELLIAITFNPNEAANEIAAGRLPGSVVSWQHRAGTIANSHFLAIPFNAPAKDAAKVVIDFLQSPPAQARKADIRHWGDPTVLAMDKLAPAERALFTSGAAPGVVTQPAPALPEPHASWVGAIEREWALRYGQ
jgi:putative thiamine transport system substrate-binding protein